MSRLPAMVLILFLAMRPFTALAADESPNAFKWYPGSPLLLGRGFIQSDLSKTFVEDCVTFDTLELGGKQGDDDIKLEVSFITSYTSMLDKMGIDVEVEFHSLTAKGNASFKQNRQSFRNSNNVSVMISATAESPQVELRNVELKKDFARLLKEDPADFIERCGSRLPYIERRGVLINAMITIEDASEDLRTKMAASVGGSYGAGPVGASAQAAFNQEIEEAKNDQKVKINVTARGGDASELFEKTIESTITKLQSIEAIGASLAQYASSLKDKPARTGFVVGDMPGAKSVLNDPWSNEKQRKLGAIFEAYNLLSGTSEVYNRLIDKKDPRYELYNDAELNDLELQAQVLDDALNELRSAHSNCKNSKQLSLDYCNIKNLAALNAAKKLPIIEPLGPPSGQFLVAVRRGPKNWNSDLKNWELTSARVSRGIFRSPSRPTDDKGPDIERSGASPQNFALAHAAQVRSTFTDVQRHAVLYIIEGNKIEGFETYAELVSSEPPVDATFRPKKIQLAALGAAEIDQKSRLFLSHFPEESNRGEASFVPVLLTYGQRIDKPLPSSPFYVTKAKLEFLENTQDAIGSMPRTTTFKKPIHAWVKAGVLRGRGVIKASAVDLYGGDAGFELASFSWEADEQLSLTRVEYSFSSMSDTFVWYATNTSERAKIRYPWIIKSVTFKTGVSGAAPTITTLSPLQPKWTDLKISNCRLGKWTVINTDLPAELLWLTTSLTPTQITLSATYGTPLNPTAARVGGHAEFAIGLVGTLDHDPLAKPRC